MHTTTMDERVMTTARKNMGGRRSYLDTMAQSIATGARVAGLEDQAAKAMVLAAIQGDVRIGGRDGLTLAELLERCEAALNTAGFPTNRKEIIEILADPRMRDDAAELAARLIRRPKRTK